MKNEFIETANGIKFNNVCAELADPTSMIGPSIAMVTGPAGRGKSESAKYYATQTSAIYIPPMNVRSPAMVLREITFELCKLKPSRSEACLNIIQDEIAKERRLIIIDEADLLPMAILEMLRNINERYACPIMLIGEEELKGKIASRRRLSSRIRRHVEFSPVGQADIVLYLRKALKLQKISPEVTGIIHRYSRGDWRPVLNAAISIERAMLASGITEITEELANDVTKNS